MNIRLCKMTKPLARAYFREFRNDPDLFMDMGRFSEYEYDPKKVDAYVERYRRLGRIHLAILLDQEPIGELILKNVDRENRCCTLGICMKNDTVKNRGYGTRAEILALEYAFTQLGMETVYADAIHKNTRSQHVLQKAGFNETHRDEAFVYYRCDRSTWKPETDRQPRN